MNLHPSQPIIVTLTRVESMRMAIALTAGLWPQESYPHEAVEYAFASQGRLTDHDGKFRPVAWATSLTVHDIAIAPTAEWDGGAPE